MKTTTILKNNIALIIMVVLLIIFTITTGGVLISSYNLKSIFDQTVQTLIGGLGVLFVIAMGSTDLSIGGTAAVSATLACLLSERFGAWIMVPAALLIALFIGLINGIVITRFRISSFMCTLAMLIALRGLLNVLIEGRLVFAPSQIKVINQFTPKLVIFVLLLLVMSYLFTYTKLGKYAKAMGENERAAVCIGINTSRIRAIGFALSV